ncbi:MAG: RNA-binding transcriptional accessory protein [Nitrospirae bacterium YQR-1]
MESIEINPSHVEKISQELHLTKKQVEATCELLDGGATVPFIARYRKELTGSLDELNIAGIGDLLKRHREVDKRRTAIISSLEDSGKMTEQLREKLNTAETLSTLEDIYLPYRPKRKTRASIARERGLEPLAAAIFAQTGIDPVAEAQKYLNPEKSVETAEAALSGARDIIAEWVNEDAQARTKMRRLFAEKAIIKSKLISEKEEEGIKYRDYFQWEEPARSAPSHRVLAMRRGEKESVLTLRILPHEDKAIGLLTAQFIKGGGPDSLEVERALKDSYKRLLSLSMETELRMEIKKRADSEAIRVFSENLRNLLLAPPLGGKNVLAIDPGIRTGCKIVCLNRQGMLIHNDMIYPLIGKASLQKDAEKVTELCKKFNIEAIAIGNGTGGRETELFIRGLELPADIIILMVSESGASVYSASEAARQEFPTEDVTVRGAVSIGRRLMDPLSELVKIDPRSIGVGQYQHDVDQGDLKETLDGVVSSCVSAVGVELNTASKELLSYVPGIGGQLALNIVNYRNENGPFLTKQSLKKVPKLGPKAFEQSAGFLRIRDGQNPLDRSAVHPESYHIVQTMAADMAATVSDLIRNESLRQKIDLSRYITGTAGLPTLNDIMAELAKPGRDPRESFDVFSFQEGINKIEDVKPGMKLPGIVTNVTAFGAFVDIGVHTDGLVHISQLSDKFVKNPGQIVKVNQKVEATVVEVDVKRRRISLSLKSDTNTK